jgi:LuxR family maltose regulon positive regulatory protein
MYLRPSFSCAPSKAIEADEDATFTQLKAALQHICSVASQGRVPESCDHLLPWLRIGATRGLLMVFIDTGPPLLQLLERLYSAPSSGNLRLAAVLPYIATLRLAAKWTPQESPFSQCRPLSRRETDILKMIAHGMSNKRIAYSLGITPETVKSHTKSIFIKLESRTRAQAVSRAETMGFL